MIRNPNEIQEGAKKIRMLIAGYPGIGKSTLALSAPNPLHIDVDFGIDRIEPRYRKPYIQPKSYDEILEDLTPLNVKDFDTLVFDTGGKLISLMSQWAIKKDVKYGQRDGSLSLKGYGFIGREFQRLMDYCFYELDKHIVVVFHAIEEKDGDNTRLRIKASLVVEYGALAKDADGLTVGFKLPASVDVSTIYPYVKCFDTRVENGKMFKCYLVYKQTHLMDSKEMARLIDGAIEVAKELGIETDTPEQLARYKEDWNKE